MELTGPARPQGGITAPDRVDQLAVRDRDETPRWWWLGVHGGAGESTLERITEDTLAAGHAWPRTSGETPVVLVCRQSIAGLQAARRAATHWASGDTALGRVKLMGLVVMAHSAGRPPKPIVELERLVAGCVPTVWRVGWQREWWAHDPAELAVPRAVRKLCDEIEALLDPAHERNDDA